VYEQVEARRADTFIGNVKLYAAPSALVVLGFLIHGLTAVAIAQRAFGSLPQRSASPAESSMSAHSILTLTIRLSIVRNQFHQPRSDFKGDRSCQMTDRRLELELPTGSM
jgi:hypothetical protein